jgi:putative addiction module component (TIGR02574 family)
LCSRFEPYEESAAVKANELIEMAASLPVEDRVLIADSLLRSLNPPQSDIDQKWADVANHRLDELQNGRSQAVAGEEVFDRIWNRFKS